MMSDASYLRRGALAVASVALLGYLSDYAFNIGLTHFLSPESYGDYKVAYSFAFFFGLAVLLGGDRAAPMVLAPALQRQEQRQVWEYLRFYLRNALLLGLVVIAVTWTVSYHQVRSLNLLDHHPIVWVALVVPVNAVAAMASRTLQSARRPALAALPWRIGLPLTKLGFFALVVAELGTLGIEEAVLIGVMAAVSITLIQALWVLRLGLVKVNREPAFSKPRVWLTASLPMMGSFLVALALNQSDLYFLELLGDEAQVGHYAAAAVAAHFVLLVQTTLVGLIAPLVRPAIEAGESASRNAYRQGQRLMLTLVIPVAVLLAVAGEPILGLFGGRYRVGYAVLELLVFGNSFWAVAALSALWLQYQGQARVALTISMSMLLVDSGLNVLLIPHYGMDGAAAGSALTLAAGAVTLVLVRKNLWKSMVRA